MRILYIDADKALYCYMYVGMCVKEFGPRGIGLTFFSTLFCL